MIHDDYADHVHAHRASITTKLDDLLAGPTDRLGRTIGRHEYQYPAAAAAAELNRGVHPDGKTVALADLAADGLATDFTRETEAINGIPPAATGRSMKPNPAQGASGAQSFAPAPPVTADQHRRDRAAALLDRTYNR